MKRFFGILAILILLAANIAVPVAAQEEGPLDEAPTPVVDATTLAPEGHRLWFIEFASNPLADGGSAVRVAKEKSDFRAAARRAGIPFTERFAFDTLWNGISIDASATDVNRLARLPGVKAIYPVIQFQIPPNQSPNLPELETALQMTGADIVQNELGFTGKGIKVAVMDTGIDFDHPDLGGCFGPGCRVEMGWDFVGDDYNANPGDPSYNPIPSPDPIPDDCNGHGTHVAGIIGANGAIKGVAPEVTFGAYRVFGCTGSTESDIMIAAMERALADGMDVLNMSIGSAFTWPQYPTAQASDRLVTKGMVVVASIGNSGANGPFAAGAPGLGKKVIGVASFDNSHVSALTFNVLPGGRQVPYLALANTTPAPTSGVSDPVVFVGGNGCLTQANYPDVTGKTALIERGTCTFNEKYARAVGAGATGVVIYNNVTGLFAGGGVTDLGVFGVGISQADGMAIRALLNAGETVTLEFTDVRINAQNPTGGLISSFSSYGLAPDLTLKPDIGAPGGLIRSTYPLELGGYEIISGTSMSSPHVAGAVALLLQARPDVNPNTVRTLLLNSADPKNWSGNPALGFLEFVHRQGAGMLDIDSAILAKTFIEPAKLSLGEIESGSVTQTLTIKNTSTEWQKFEVLHVPALATGPNSAGSMYFTWGTYASFATVSFSAAQVDVPPLGKATVNVTITRPASSMRQFGGYIIFDQVNGDGLYSVPYAGFSGDYQAISPMLLNPYGLPWLLKDGMIVGIEIPENPVYTLVDGDVPLFWVQLSHQVRSITGEVFKVDAKGRTIPYYRAFHEDYVPRNAASNNIWEFVFNGTTMAGNTMRVVPDGQYYVVIKALKPLGDPNNPAHWETWTSPLFTIDRP